MHDDRGDRRASERREGERRRDEVTRGAVPEWHEVGFWLIEETRERKSEFKEIRAWLHRLDRKQFVLWGAAGVIFAAGLWVVQYRIMTGFQSAIAAQLPAVQQAPPPVVTQTYTPAGRIAQIQTVWSQAQRFVSGTNCPTVAELDRLLPQLRGVDARERDYVAFLVGVQC